ncbi:MAG: hypothetical protein IPP72_08700 [Chitinophagaceae bacterium]|nr:hypothetical protein [Chitinophagaceae bacterium]
MKIILPILSGKNGESWPGKNNCKPLKTAVQKTTVIVFCVIASIAVTGQTNTWDVSSSTNCNKAVDLSRGLMLIDDHDGIIFNGFNITADTAAVYNPSAISYTSTTNKSTSHDATTTH